MYVWVQRIDTQSCTWITNILHRTWVVSGSSSATGAAYRFADISSTDMSCGWVQWVWNYNSELRGCRTDQLPTATTGCTEECARPVRNTLLLCDMTCREWSWFYNMASFLACSYLYNNNLEVLEPTVLENYTSLRYLWVSAWVSEWVGWLTHC